MVVLLTVYIQAEITKKNLGLVKPFFLGIFEKSKGGFELLMFYYV